MRTTHRDLYASFASHGVRYMVIGGVAAVMHGSPRMTADLDIVIEATVDNARRLLEALRAAGMGTAFLIEAEDILAREVTILDDWIPLDVHVAPPGVDFAEAWERRTTATVEGVPVHCLGLEDLIRSKEAAGRPVDREDVAILREIARQMRENNG